MARTLKRHRGILGLFSVALCLALAGFSVAPVAFAQTSTATSTSGTTNGTITSTSDNTSTTTGTTSSATSDNTGTGTSTSTTVSTTTGSTGSNTSSSSGTTVMNTGTTNSNGSTTEATTNNSSTTPITIMIMEHLCNSNVRNVNDLSSAGGINSTNGFLWAESNCPTTAKGNDMPASSSIAAVRTGFDYSVTGDNGQSSQTLSNATYNQNKLCESQVNFDVNGDGTINPNTCLDTSSYAFNLNNTNGNQVTVQQTNPPADYHYGFVLFTPQSIQSNDNASALVSSTASDNGQGTIILNPSNITDHTIMLHVFNLLDTGSASSTASSTGTMATSTGSNSSSNNNTGNTNTTSTTTNNTASSTTNNTSTTTSNTASSTATTTNMMPSQITDNQFAGIVNILQRVEDIQSQIINLFQAMFSR